MSSKKNTPIARTPQRERGQKRVSALLKSATALFAEKGFAATTMTEIAQRANAPIGSLYQFFPSKDLIAEALMARYLELVSSAMTRIEERAAALSSDKLAQALLGVLADLKHERAVAVGLIDVQPQNASARVTTFRTTVLNLIERVLKQRNASLRPARIRAAAWTVLQQMKTAAALDRYTDAGTVVAIRTELTKMLARYLDTYIDA